MSSFLMKIFPVVCALSVTVRAAVLSIDPAYKNWEKLFATDGYVRVPVYIEEAKYTGAGQAACIQTIKDAVAAMNTGLNGCVQFIILPSPVNVGRPFLWISNSLNNNVAAPTCQSVPGRVDQPQNQGQKLVILGGTGVGACCGSVRDVMRYLAHTLGLRNEYQREDRDTFIAVDSSKIHPSLTSPTDLKVYDKYTPARALTFPRTSTNPTAAVGNFDFNSITMVQPSRYAQAGQTVWTQQATAPAGKFDGSAAALPFQNAISFQDCQALAAKYGCLAPGSTCADPFG